MSSATLWAQVLSTVLIGRAAIARALARILLGVNSNGETGTITIAVAHKERRPTSDRNYADLLTYITDRLGDDFRCAIDCAQIESELGWKQRETFATGLQKTVDWYLANPGQLARHS